MFLSFFNYGSVLINHLHVVIPLSYPCHYTNLCPHKPYNQAHTHTRIGGDAQWSSHTLYAIIHHRNEKCQITEVKLVVVLC